MTTLSTDDANPDTWNVFLCYRQVDGGKSAEWLHEHLHDCPLPTGQEDAPRLNVYFDQTAAAVANWKELHQPALEKARAMIMVCTPGATYASGSDDFVHKEIQWWMKNRKAASILVDTTGEGERWVPGPIRNRWPDAQRLHVDVDAWARLPEAERTVSEKRVVQRIAQGILLSESEVRDEELERKRRTQRKLVVALVLAGITTLVAAWQWRSAAESADEANQARGREEAANERLRQDAARLSDQSAFGRALLAVDGLFPTSADKVADAKRVVDDAREAAGRLSEHGAERDRMRSIAAPSPEDVASLRLLTVLIRDGESVSNDNVLDLLSTRFEPAPIAGDAPSWEDAIAAIRDKAKNPIYAGLVIFPQFGLYPLGQDPKSGLFEFVHLYSGGWPTRDPSTGPYDPGNAAIVFVLIPGGEYRRGASQNEDDLNYDSNASEDEGPPHEVKLSPFFLSKYECTQAQWARLTGVARPSHIQFDKVKDASWRKPVERVSWDACAGNPGWLVRYGLALPTEAQWEYACRAPFLRDRTPVKYERWSGCADEKALLDAARIRDNSDLRTWAVGGRDANRWGLHDMHGNVWEWCQDRWGFGGYGKRDGGGDAHRTDPMLPPGELATLRVIRGGSSRFIATAARSAFRCTPVPGVPFDVGFRPAKPITSK